MGKLELTVL